MLGIESCKKYNIDKDINSAVNKAKELYLNGSVFVYPTDTIYGFGANPFNESSVERINQIKNRTTSKKNILLINNIENLLKYVNIAYEKHIDFLLNIWPNPISVVLNLNKKFSKILNSNNIAFRIPNHIFCKKLLNELQMPLLSTSVNKTDSKSLNEYSLIIDEFENNIDALFYTEYKNNVEASTLIDLTKEQPTLLREGKIKFSEVMKKYK